LSKSVLVVVPHGVLMQMDGIGLALSPAAEERLRGVASSLSSLSKIAITGSQKLKVQRRVH
jgi:hypothetical protein